MTDSIESPCTNNCCLVDGVCVGCGRTQAEIFNWQSLSEEEKEEIIERLRNEREV